MATLLEPVAGELLHQIELLYGIAWLGAAILPIYPGSAPAWRGQIVAHMGAAWLLAGRFRRRGPLRRPSTVAILATRKHPDQRGIDLAGGRLQRLASGAQP